MMKKVLLVLVGLILGLVIPSVGSNTIRRITTTNNQVITRTSNTTSSQIVTVPVPILINNSNSTDVKDTIDYTDNRVYDRLGFTWDERHVVHNLISNGLEQIDELQKHRADHSISQEDFEKQLGFILSATELEIKNTIGNEKYEALQQSRLGTI